MFQRIHRVLDDSLQKNFLNFVSDTIFYAFNLMDVWTQLSSTSFRICLPYPPSPPSPIFTITGTIACPIIISLWIPRSAKLNDANSQSNESTIPTLPIYSSNLMSYHSILICPTNSSNSEYPLVDSGERAALNFSRDSNCQSQSLCAFTHTLTSQLPTIFLRRKSLYQRYRP